MTVDRIAVPRPLAGRCVASDALDIGRSLLGVRYALHGPQCAVLLGSPVLRVELLNPAIDAVVGHTGT